MAKKSLSGGTPVFYRTELSQASGDCDRAMCGHGQAGRLNKVTGEHRHRWEHGELGVNTAGSIRPGR